MSGRSMLTRRYQEMPPKKAIITPAPGVPEEILPVNSREISALYGVVLAVTGVGGGWWITHGKWYSTAQN